MYRVKNFAQMLIIFALVVMDLHAGAEATETELGGLLNSTEKDIGAVVQSILDIILSVLPTLKEYVDPGPVYLFVSTRHDLVMLNVSKNSLIDKTVVTTTGEDDGIVATDYDPVDDFVYWTTYNGLMRMKLNGEERREIYSGEDVSGIAVDWVGRNIYIANDELNRIAVSRLDGSHLKTIIGDGIDGPRGIAVDPGRGRVYWTEWKSNPRIASAAMDGSDVWTLVKHGIKWPNGLALDCNKGLVFFADASFNRIEVVRMDGTFRRVITDRDVRHVYGLSYLGGYLYLTEWYARTADRISIDDPSDRITLEETHGSILGIKATYLRPDRTTNPCADNNGGCSHLCLFTGKNVTCG